MVTLFISSARTVQKMMKSAVQLFRRNSQYVSNLNLQSPISMPLKFRKQPMLPSSKLASPDCPLRAPCIRLHQRSVNLDGSSLHGVANTARSAKYERLSGHFWPLEAPKYYTFQSYACRTTAVFVDHSGSNQIANGEAYDVFSSILAGECPPKKFKSSEKVIEKLLTENGFDISSAAAFACKAHYFGASTLIRSYTGGDPQCSDWVQL